MKPFIALLLSISLSACSPSSIPVSSSPKNPWLLVDNFEQTTLENWTNLDTQNDTAPFVANPQITKIISDDHNQYLIKKPAKDGVVGNRKALSFTQLPEAVAVGEIYTFYTEILVEQFPNNHAFGLSNMDASGIAKHAYNAFEPTLRVTDKYESNGFKNDGTLMVKIDSDDKYRQYSKVQNYNSGKPATPLQTSQWYKIWYVVNNNLIVNGGQSYDVYMQGGEFSEQTLVFRQANFRMKREQPLIYFFATCNTGPQTKPYGNGGLAYDNIFMSKGINLSLPTID
ncbi:hypothetical protein E2K93_15660 [Thalassotalea sp. HSM 43]|uniref:hypothetical protein n=1 Tax=Thalassotalea sp. HSM 43 TaxID=2552945 RepID=UPI001081DCFC|nr:hypothetical protein [Thalassotalea sp. HSM 43]QBY05709.1 hypothetical protein E2K93_15660 [Thalassotalea sp. HSM 43]